MNTTADPAAGDPPLAVLLLEDSPLDAELMAAALGRGGVRADLRRVDAEADYLRALAGADVDLILSDYFVPGYDGMAALAAARRLRPGVPFLFVSGTIGEEVAIDALHQGATDYVLKHRLDRLAPAVRRAVAESRAAADRDRAVAALRGSEERLRLAQQVAHVGTFEWNIVTGVNVWSPELEALYGLPPGGFGGSYPAWAACVHPDDLPGAEERVGEALATGAFAAEWRVVRADDGRVRWLAARGRVFADHNGRPVRMIGVNIDVTERREAEDALRDAGRRKDEFLATLAHELRNPLAPVRNAVHILKLAGTDADKIAVARGLIERQVGQMVRLIDDLLDVNRIARNKIALRRGRLPLGEAVGLALEAVRPAIDAAGHALSVDLPADDPVLDADQARVAQILSNLVGNAAKFTPPGGRIGLSAAVEAGELVVRVTDTGVGIAAANLARIFEPFAQVGTPPGKEAGGLGIGLSLVRGLVELHGGTVAAASPGPGAGSTFTVRLPLAGPPAAAASPPAAGPLSARRVLVVDDLVDSGQSLGLLLQLFGQEVRVVHDGPAALDAIGAFRPDVVLLDLGMPGMDGLEVARRVKATLDGSSPVLVAVTGYGQEEDRGRTKAAGFAAHLVKPVDPEELRRVLGGL